MAWTIGREHVLSFLENCFRGQRYRLTTLGTVDHDMWDFTDDEEEDSAGPGVRFG